SVLFLCAPVTAYIYTLSSRRSSDLTCIPCRRKSLVYSFVNAVDLFELRHNFRVIHPRLIKSVLKLHVSPPLRCVRHEPVFVFVRSEEHTSELQSRFGLVCRLLHEQS